MPNITYGTGVRRVVVNTRGAAVVVVCVTESGWTLLSASCDVIILTVVT
jgi:hypothetical protein